MWNDPLYDLVAVTPTHVDKKNVYYEDTKSKPFKEASPLTRPPPLWSGSDTIEKPTVINSLPQLWNRQGGP